MLIFEESASMSPNVLEKLRSLPPEKQQEVEDYVVFLAQKYGQPQHSTDGVPHENVSGTGNNAIMHDAVELPEDY
jgi:hypothetical protein